MANKIQFYSGQSENFKNLETKDNNTLYFLEDVKEIYKGSNRVAIGKDKIHVGTDAPTDPDVIVWVDPDGEATEVIEGTSPTIEVLENTETSYILSITDVDRTIETPNLKGAAGYTPVKGTDYFTETDKAEIITQVLDTINGSSVFGYVDENNNIVVSGKLDDGAYTVKYELEDGTTLNIGDLVLDTNTYYSVTSNLINCTNSNSETSIVKGESYSATISANAGYEISSLVVTMGGTDISSTAVSGGSISVANVTGNIIIIAVANETTVEITNWIEEVGYTANTRLSLSSGNTTTATDYECTGFIPAKIGDVLRIKNVDLTSENATNIVFYDSSKNPIICNGSNHGISLAYFFTLEANDVYKGTITGTKYDWTAPANTAYIRIGSKSITADSILTVNEEIEPSYNNLAKNFTSGRFNSSGDIVAQDGATTCTDYIAAEQGDVIRIKGFGALMDYRTVQYDDNKTVSNVGIANALTNAYATYAYDSSTGIVTLTIQHAQCYFIRFSGILTGTTADVIITRNEEIEPSYNNLADPTSTDWAVASRFTSGGVVTAVDGLTADITNYIPVENGSVVRVKGMNLTSKLSNSSVTRQAFYTLDGTTKVFIAVADTSATHASYVTVDGNGVYTITISDDLISALGINCAVKYIRLNGTLTGTKEDVIITVNKEI